MTESTRQVPGPGGVSAITNVLALWKNPLELFERHFRRYGPLLRMRFAWEELFLVANAADVQHILQRNNRNYIKGRNYDGLRLTLGNGLVTSEGEFWRRQRKLAQPAFHRERIAGFADTMQAATKELVDKWQAATRAGASTIDVHHDMTELTLHIVLRTLFGTHFDGDLDTITRSVPIVLEYSSRYVKSPVHLPLALPTPGNIRFRRALKALDSITYDLIRARREDSSREQSDILDMFMAATDDDGQRMSDKQLRDEVVTMIGAGHETTATTVTIIWHLLSQNPDVLEKLEQEVDTVLQGQPPTLETLGQLKYTDKVIKEALRLYPPIWAVERQSLQADELSGCPIPANALILISNYFLHRNPDVWDRPEEFDPERFTPEAEASRPAFSYLPFSGGPRICIGNAFAMMEAKIIVAMVVQHFRLASLTNQPPEFTYMVTMRPKDGLKYRVTPRDRQDQVVREAS